MLPAYASERGSGYGESHNCFFSHNFSFQAREYNQR